MASQLGARKSDHFKAVSSAPSFNKTPVGSATPPLPYPVTQDLSGSIGVIPNVRFNGDPVYVLNQSTQPHCVGDAAGVCKGVKSGTVSGEVKPVKGSSTVKIAGKAIIREGDPCTLNGGNCPGLYITVPAPSGIIQNGRPSADSNPPVSPETPKEASWWTTASPWVHGVLGVASFVPGLSVLSGSVDAAIYLGEGNLVEAGLSAASIIPGGKIATTAGKLAKGAMNLAKGAHAAEEAARAAKLAKEAEEAAKLAREAEAAAKLKKAEDEAARLKRVEEEAEAGGKGRDGAKVKGKKGGPCDHLRQGNGKGPYRGGAHSKTSGPAKDGKDSHHMPADAASPLPTNSGPAIQMDPNDHVKTSSNGQQGPSAKVYIRKIEKLINDGKLNEAMIEEIKDIRRVARAIGDPRKYNEAMLEMLEYFKCMRDNGLFK